MDVKRNVMPLQIEDEINKPNARFSVKEPMVLLTIIGLSLWSGLNKEVEHERYTSVPGRIVFIWVTCQTLASVLGSILMAFQSELHGRKPVFAILFALSIFTSILRVIPVERSGTCSSITFAIHGIINGGTLTMTFLAISEYSRPKNRFAYLAANIAAKVLIGPNTAYLLYKAGVLQRDSVCVPSFQIALGLVCFLMVYAWPESPYWLASKGRLQKSRATLLWLREETDAGELDGLTGERRRPGLSRLYWLPLFIAIIAITLSQLSSSQAYFRMIISFEMFPEIQHSFLYHILVISFELFILSMLVVISYHIKRRVLLICVTIPPQLLHYPLALWLFVDPAFEACVPQILHWLYCVIHIICTIGPYVLAMALFIEVLPQKYNTHMSCICVVYNDVITFIRMIITKVAFENHFDFPYYLSVSLLTTALLSALILFFWLAPETKDKDLLEVQRSYTPELAPAIPELNQLESNMES